VEEPSTVPQKHRKTDK